MTKKNRIIYWVSTGWLAVGMLATGIGQLLHMQAGTGGGEYIAHLGYPMYLLTLLGVWKILGVVALVVPHAPVVKEWAYAGFFFLMSGAVVSHVAAGSATEVAPALLLLVLTVVSWYTRPVDRKIHLAN